MLFRRGADIIDRRLFFVEKVPHTAMIPVANSTNVKPRLSAQDKVTYQGQLNQLEGVVANDHLFDVYLGECVAPYVALDPLKAALPVNRTSMTIPLSHNDCEADKHNACCLDIANLHPSMQRRWNNVAEMYREAHRNQAIKDLYSRLNHQNILTVQLESLKDAIVSNGTLRIVYTKNGEPTAAIIEDNHAIVDHALFQATCESRDEANFLMAVLNSEEMATRAKPFCTTNWAKKIRNFQKLGWKLPIPRYDAADPLHARLSELGKAAEQECAAIIANVDILTKPPGDAQARAARQLLRHDWQPNSETARAIEASVAQLLGDPAQAALAERQMVSMKGS